MKRTMLHPILSEYPWVAGAALVRSRYALCVSQVVELLHAGAKLEVGRYGQDPLYCAASNGHGERVQRLLAAGSSPQSIEDAFI